MAHVDIKGQYGGQPSTAVFEGYSLNGKVFVGAEQGVHSAYAEVDIAEVFEALAKVTGKRITSGVYLEEFPDIGWFENSYFEPTITIWDDLKGLLGGTTYDLLAEKHGGPKRTEPTFLVTVEVERINDDGESSVRANMESLLAKGGVFWLREAKVLGIEKSEREASTDLPF